MSKPVSKQSLYSMTSAKAKKAIKRLGELIDSNNDSVALGACKTILNKTLPDIKTIEVERIEAIEASSKIKLIKEVKELKERSEGGIILSMDTKEAKEYLQKIG